MGFRISAADWCLMFLADRYHRKEIRKHSAKSSSGSLIRSARKTLGFVEKVTPLLIRENHGNSCTTSIPADSTAKHQCWPCRR
jgi:hypothetical protein